jgi:guanylate cyclase soluble subunit beta
MRTLDLHDGADVSMRDVAASCSAFALQIKHPYVAWDWAQLAAQAGHSRFLFVHTASGLELKGQLAVTAFPGPAAAGGQQLQEEALLFMGSPRLCNLEDMRQHNLYMCDLPLWDMSADFALLAEQRQVGVGRCLSPSG